MEHSTSCTTAKMVTPTTCPLLIPTQFVSLAPRLPRSVVISRTPTMMIILSELLATARMGPQDHPSVSQ